MKKYIIIPFIIYLMSLCTCNAQTFQLGFSGLVHKQTGMILTSFDPGSAQGIIQSAKQINEHSGTPGISLLYYQPIVHAGEIFSAGIQTGFVFYGYYEAPKEIVNISNGAYVGQEGGSPLILAFQIPTSIMARVGNLAVKESEIPIGGAVGIGFVPFGFTTPLDKGFMMPLNLCAEINVLNFGFRLDFPQKKFQSVYKTYTGDIPRITTSFYSMTFLFGVFF